jgi:acyl carrier protein
MEKNKFFEELKENLEFEGELDEKTPINLTSIATLSLIVFIDENFNKLIKASELKNIAIVNDLIVLIGEENIK